MIRRLEELADDMNGRIYRIQIDVLMKNLNKYKAQKELLTQMFMETYGIELSDEDNYLGLRKYIGSMENELRVMADIIKKLKNRLTIEGLRAGFEATGKEIFKIAQLYVTVVKKHEAYLNLYNQLGMRPNLESEITIVKHLNLIIAHSEKLNRKIIRTKDPTFNALNIEEIKELLGFWEHKECRDEEEILEFINKHESVFQREYSSNYLVKGNVIFYTIYPTELSI